MNQLHARAAEVESEIEQALVDRHGLIRSAVDINTMRPFTPGYFEGCSVHPYASANLADYGDFITYENVGMCSGAFLAAMVLKYLATGDPAAWRKARRTFQGICWLFDLGRGVEEGFYCKCYCGRLSDQISSDQYVFTMAGLDQYLLVADRAEKAACTAMLAQMARFWMRRGYAYPYFGKPLAWPLERFPVFSWLAWQHSAQPEFRREYDRLCALPEVQDKIPFGALTWDALLGHARNRKPVFDFEKQAPLRLIRLNPENTASGFLSVEALLHYQAPMRELWLAKAMQMYARDCRWIAEDGLAMGAGLYNVATGEVTEVRQVLHVPAAQPGQWRYGGFVGWIRSGMHAAMFARAALALAPYLPGRGAREKGLEILGKLHRDQLRWFIDMDGRQFPEDLTWMHHVYSGDAAVNWLWGYWQARANA